MDGPPKKRSSHKRTRVSGATVRSGSLPTFDAECAPYSSKSASGKAAATIKEDNAQIVAKLNFRKGDLNKEIVVYNAVPRWSRALLTPLG